MFYFLKNLACFLSYFFPLAKTVFKTMSSSGLGWHGPLILDHGDPTSLPHPLRPLGGTCSTIVVPYPLLTYLLFDLGACMWVDADGWKGIKGKVEVNRIGEKWKIGENMEILALTKQIIACVTVQVRHCSESYGLEMNIIFLKCSKRSLLLF